MVLSKEKIRVAYQKQAKSYGFSVKLYRLMGIRLEAYRSCAVHLLRLKRGDCVVDLGCGTGLNFPLLIDQIGPEGRLIGVDFSSEMLECAQKKVDRFRWNNVQLVQSYITEYELPNGVNGVMSTGVFGYVSEYNCVIERISHALTSGGRLVILDGKRPEHWPLWLFKSFVRLSRPFGLTLNYFDHHTWDSSRRFLEETAVEEKYAGLFYILSGTAP